MSAHLQLAKGYNPDKLSDKVFASVKLDGVPVRIDMRYDGEWFIDSVLSRQGKPVPSTEFIVRDLRKIVQSALPDGLAWGNKLSFVGEVTHESYKDFKDVSGVVRRKEPQTGLILNLFDYCDYSKRDDFAYRWNALLFVLLELAHFRSNSVRAVDQIAITKSGIAELFNSMLFVDDEGGIIRDANDKWAPGKRTWGYQKYVVDPTIDLRITGFEEAVDKHGEPMGMVGRVLASYQGRTIGVGPGKLTHNERMQEWVQYCNHGQHITHPRLACIKYKRDPSYSDLRQPTFQHWRYDKDEPDA